MTNMVQRDAGLGGAVGASIGWCNAYLVALSSVSGIGERPSILLSPQSSVLPDDNINEIHRLLIDEHPSPFPRPTIITVISKVPLPIHRLGKLQSHDWRPEPTRMMPMWQTAKLASSNRLAAPRSSGKSACAAWYGQDGGLMSYFNNLPHRGKLVPHQDIRCTCGMVRYATICITCPICQQDPCRLCNKGYQTMLKIQYKSAPTT